MPQYWLIFTDELPQPIWKGVSPPSPLLTAKLRLNMALWTIQGASLSVNGWWMQQRKYLSSSYQVPDLSFCHRFQLRHCHICHIRHECQIKYLTITRDTPISASAIALSSKSVKGARWNTRRKDLLLLSHILPPAAAQPITPCHWSPDPSREGRNVGAAHLTSQSSPSVSHLVWSLATVAQIMHQLIHKESMCCCAWG